MRGAEAETWSSQMDFVSFDFLFAREQALTPPFELFVNAILSPHEVMRFLRGARAQPHSVIRILRPSPARSYNKRAGEAASKEKPLYSVLRVRVKKIK